jgi:group I intron endonuclease
LRGYYNINNLIRNNTIISKSLIKYGYINFSVEILEYCSPENRIEREQYYFDLLNPEYNILKKAGSPLGYKHSKYSIEKLKSYRLTDDQRVRYLEAIERINCNPHICAKRLEHIKQLNATLEQKERLKKLNSDPEGGVPRPPGC